MNKIEHALFDGDTTKIVIDAATPDCQKCGGPSTAPGRQGMPSRMMFAMSDLTQLNDAYASVADLVLENCNVKIVGQHIQAR